MLGLLGIPKAPSRRCGVSCLLIIPLEQPFAEWGRNKLWSVRSTEPFKNETITILTIQYYTVYAYTVSTWYNQCIACHLATESNDSLCLQLGKAQRAPSRLVADNPANLLRCSNLLAHYNRPVGCRCRRFCEQKCSKKKLQMATSKKECYLIWYTASFKDQSKREHFSNTTKQCQGTQCVRKSSTESDSGSSPHKEQTT